MTGIINCAHRGASALGPENSMSALKRAVDVGASMAEIDIQQTTDDQLVLFHDTDLDRTSSGSGPLWKNSLEQLKLLDVGAWFSLDFEGERILTLEEAVNAMRGRLELNIEMKMHGNERNIEQLVAEKLQGLDCLDWCLVSSFDWDAVDRLRELVPQLKAGYIVGRGRWDAALLDCRVSFLSLEKSLVTAERVQAIHAAGKVVHVWTVNEVEDMKRLQSLGVDVLISNYPDRVFDHC